VTRKGGAGADLASLDAAGFTFSGWVATVSGWIVTEIGASRGSCRA